jgi:hypothetical protein
MIRAYHDFIEPAGFMEHSLLREGILPLIQKVIGWVVSISMIMGSLAFPLYKGAPLGYIPIMIGFGVASIFLLPSTRRMIYEGIMRLQLSVFLGFVVGLGLLLRLAVSLNFNYPLASDELSFHLNAISILDGKGYGHSALYPPGMTFFLVGVYFVFGPSITMARVVFSFVGGFFVILSYDLARRAATPFIGRVTALLAAFFPSILINQATLGYEILLGCFVLGFCGVIFSMKREDKGLTFRALILGLLMGIGSLVKPVCLLLPVVLFFSLWLRSFKAIRCLKYCGIAVLVMVVFIAPWTIRNYYEFKRFLLISNNDGFILYNANNPKSKGLYMNINYRKIEKVPEGVDEIEMNNILFQKAIKWIIANPISFVKLMGPKISYTWGTDSTVVSSLSRDRMSSNLETLLKGAANIFWGILIILFAYASFMCGVWRRHEIFWPTIAVLVYIWLIHLFFEAASRHHLPVIAVMFLVGAHSLQNSRQYPDDGDYYPSPKMKQKRMKSLDESRA